MNSKEGSADVRVWLGNHRIIADRVYERKYSDWSKVLKVDMSREVSKLETFL